MTEARTVLVVDDNEELAENLAEILEDEGFTAVPASCGSDALRALQGDSVALVVTDVRMPDMNGVELLRYVRERWPSLPVILMTAYAKEALLDEARTEGALEVLGKPLDLGRLMNMVTKAVSHEGDVMLVEDDDDLRTDLMAALKDVAQVVPHAARTGDEARRLVSQKPMRAAIIDLKLPDEDGVHLGADLQRLEPDLPVIFITGHPERYREAIDGLLTSSKVQVLQKPFEPGDLIAAVKAFF